MEVNVNELPAEMKQAFVVNVSGMVGGHYHGLGSKSQPHSLNS